jgi:hypothetical protein
MSYSNRTLKSKRGLFDYVQVLKLVMILSSWSVNVAAAGLIPGGGFIFEITWAVLTPRNLRATQVSTSLSVKMRCLSECRSL